MFLVGASTDNIDVEADLCPCSGDESVSSIICGVNTIYSISKTIQNMYMNIWTGVEQQLQRVLAKNSLRYFMLLACINREHY